MIRLAGLRRMAGWLMILPTLLTGGCAAFGLAARVLPPPSVPASYKDMQNQSVGVMVWADRGIVIDKPNIQLDVANTVQARLASAAAKSQDLKGMTFPIEPLPIFRYQKDYPQVESMNVTDVAPHFKGLSRLIYVELQDFRTRSEESVMLYHGSAAAIVEVIAIQDGKGTVVFKDDGVTASFPEKGPPEGSPHLSESAAYQGTVAVLGDTIAKLFYKHESEQE